MNSPFGRERTSQQANSNSRYNPYNAAIADEVFFLDKRRPPYDVPPPPPQTSHPYHVASAPTSSTLQTEGPIGAAVRHFIEQEEVHKNRMEVPSPFSRQAQEISEMKEEMRDMSRIIVTLEKKLEESEKSRELQRKFSNNMANVMAQEMNRLTQDNQSYSRRLDRIETVLKANEKSRK